MSKCLDATPLDTCGVTGIQRLTYDENGQKQTSTDPLGRITTYGYNNRNRLETTTEPKRTSQPANPVTRFDYDAAGNKRQVTFPDNTTQQWDLYDPFGQAWQFTDERHNVTDLVYTLGPMKKLQTVKTYRQRDNPPGGTEMQQTDFQYDGMGRANKTIFPDTSTEVTTYKLGQIYSYQTRRGQTKVIDQYDARERETHHYWLKPDGVTLDGTTPDVTSRWDDAGRMTRILNVFSTIDYTYDDAGQVVTESSSIAGSGGQTPLGTAVSGQLGYRRYPSGEVAQITYPNGAVVTRGYTARGQLAGVGWPGGSTSYAYRPDGDVDYQAWSNNITTTYGYDGRGMISSVLHRNTQVSKDLARRDYWRNDRDQILAWKRGTVNNPNAMEDGRGDRFGYDEEGQLTSASYRVATPEGIPGTALRTDVFEYDKMGNRMGTHNLASQGSTNFTRDNNGLNQYSSWTPSAIRQDDDMGGDWGSPGHANGVTMQEGWITASYNALNQPMAMWCPTYGSNFLWFGYDPLGRCVKRWMGSATGNAPNSTPATFYYYDGVNMVQEGSSAVAATRIYVHGAGVDQIVASYVVSLGEWRYHHYDGQGNCILLTDINGAIREQYDYDAFGMPYFYSVTGGKLVTAAQWGNRFLFTGREWLSDLRIYDYRARQYQPELGRFLQPDPKEFSAGDYNLYRYCHNDPVNKSDPTGMVELIPKDFQWEFAMGRLEAGPNGGGGGGPQNPQRPSDAGKSQTQNGFPAVNPRAVLNAAEKYKSDIENAVRGSQHTAEGIEYGSKVLETRKGTLETTKVQQGDGIKSVPGENRMAQTTTISNTNKDRQLVGYIVGYAHYNSGQVLRDVREAAKYSNIKAAVLVGVYAGRMVEVPYVRGQTLPAIPGLGYPY